MDFRLIQDNLVEMVCLICYALSNAQRSLKLMSFLFIVSHLQAMQRHSQKRETETERQRDNPIYLLDILLVMGIDSIRKAVILLKIAYPLL